MRLAVSFFSFLTCLVVALCLPTDSVAGVQAPLVRTAQGHSFLMCDNESTSAVPCATSSGDTFAFVQNYDTLTFFFSEAGSGATCEAYAFGYYDENGDAADPIGETNLENFTTDSLFSTSLSATQRVITLSYTDFSFVFVTCTDASSMDVTVEVRGSCADNVQCR